MFYNTETYNCAVDEKGRILVPAKFRKDNESLIEKGFYLKQSTDFPCLELFPSETWFGIMKILNGMGAFDKKVIAYKTKFLANVKEVKLDKTNRILISKELMKVCSIGKEIQMVPLSDRYQIWDTEMYKKHLASLAEEDFTDITEKLDEMFREKLKGL
ncbi:MAG: hypothetical protein LBP67_03250 [Bacteroidales bacterium]|jgi:MraZ protein|nr:hypothetical protein [Bacteroidales bacterium]